MKVTETELPGVFTVDPERISDERGFFARVWSPGDLVAHGLVPRIAQCSVGRNTRRGTIRGLHFQAAPHAEVKLVRCTRGAIYDVAVDIRPGSATFGRWIARELSEDNLRMLYIPEGFAHGYQTLEDDTEVFYQVSEIYHPESVRGYRWDDPAFGVRWPLPAGTISERDRTHPLYSDLQGKA